MPSQPVVRPVFSSALLAALAMGFLALSSVRAGDGAAADGVVINWRSADQRFEAAEPEQAAALVRELQEMLAGGLAERLHLASGPTTVQRTASGLLQARMPARLINLSVVRVAEDGAFAGTCSQPAGALESLSQAPARPEEE